MSTSAPDRTCPKNAFTGVHVPYSPIVPQCRLCRAELDGKDLRAAGSTRALLAAGEWRILAEEALTKLAVSAKTFTSEDLTDLAGLPREEPGMNRNNAVGAIFLAAQEAGRIMKTGTRRPSRNVRSHGAQLEVWRGA